MPVRILLDAMSRLQGSSPRVVLVHNAHRKEEERKGLKKKKIFAKVEVSNPDKDWKKYPIGVAQARVGMAIAQFKGRSVLSVLVSGGNMCLCQMGAVVKTQRNSPASRGQDFGSDSQERIPRWPRRNSRAWALDTLGLGNMEANEEDDPEEGSAESSCIVLQGSGRLADVWRSLWPQRATVEFDPVKVSALLEEEIGYPPDAVGVAQLREILAHGQLASARHLQQQQRPKAAVQAAPQERRDAGHRRGTTQQVRAGHVPEALPKDVCTGLNACRGSPRHHFLCA